MTLAFSEGSIGWDIENVSLADLEAFYGKAVAEQHVAPAPDGEVDAGQGGSNGIALAAAITQTKHAMLLINPHTSFYFRAEAHVRAMPGRVP